MQATWTLPIIAAAALIGGAVADTTTVDFEGGAEGWEGPEGFGGSTVIEAADGNPGAHMHTVFNDFGLTFRNNSNPAFAQDLGQYDSVTFSMDLKVESIADFNGQTFRPWVVEVRDFDNVPAGYPWVSVWYLFDWVGQGDWTTWSVTIIDTSVTELPAGWGGFGAEDPDTFEPILPDNRTFADVLAGADEIVYTTLQPGWFFIANDYDFRLDNFTIITEGAGVPGDATGDGLVNVDDLLAVLANWGPCDGCGADVNDDGFVNVDDLLAVLANWT